jgi:hypothetical protein
MSETDNTVRTSRAMNVNDSVAAITEICRQLNIRISAIEALTSGGTRVVCASSDDAVTLRKKFKGKLIEGRVTRSPLALASGRW